MLGLGLVEVSPHARVTPPSSFSISNGSVAGQSDASSSWPAEKYEGQNGSWLRLTD